MKTFQGAMMVIIGVMFCAGLVGAQQQLPPRIDQRQFGNPPSLPRTPPNSEGLSEEEREALKKNPPPTEESSWSRFLAEWLKPRPIPKKTVIMVDDKFGYPHAAVSIQMEVVDPPEGVEQDPDIVWMRGIPPENPKSPLHEQWREHEARQMLYMAQLEWEGEHGDDEYFLDFDAAPVPPPFMDAMRFVEVDSDLPERGRWQMNFDFADMNGDGVADLILPPVRKGRAVPSIFLGAEGGKFKHWSNLKWSNNVPFDYGGVVTADFDGDGNRDLAIGIHFKAQYVVYGDGQGNFTRSEKLPCPDGRLTSRAVTAADFDNDGRQDLAFLAEIDYDIATNAKLKDRPTIWVVYNRKGGWKLDDDFIGAGVIGDNLLASDVNGDGRTDLVIASNAANYRELVFLNQPDAWAPLSGYGVLSNAYHSDVTVTAGDPGAFFSSFVQFRLIQGTNRAFTGIVRYPFHELTKDVGMPRTVPKGEVVVYDDQRFDPFFRVAAGDLNGDGFTDLVSARKSGSVEIFLQNADGLYYQENSPELQSERGTPFAIRVVDLNGDGRDDIILMSGDRDQEGKPGAVNPGGVQIYLSASSS